MLLSNNFYRWPGKSPANAGGIFHPAVYHMLDVGAVLRQLLQPAKFDTNTLDALCMLGVLHDIGKINSEFRSMLENGGVQNKRHWEVSMAWFRHFDPDILENALGNQDFVRDSLYAAAAGHHGGPPVLDSRQFRRMVSRAGKQAEQDAKQFVIEVLRLFPNANLETLSETHQEANGDWRSCSNSLSWWFSGILTISDWIGSNADWFPACEPIHDIPSYWAKAVVNAENALLKSGLTVASPSSKKAASLFSFDRYTPMQLAALSTDLPLGPTLAILEDTTGSGKTEASLLLAQRMMQAEKGSGVFFALPTMATSNAMFARLKGLKKMFNGKPSIALTHSRSGIYEGFQQVVGTRQLSKENEFEMTCADWFADGRRKSLFAHVGVGTIDQALLGILPTRFCSLRLYALSQKILIIDEAHDYDPYMQKELEALLTFHAILGGSAILMTATLPSVKRQKFIDSFQKHLLEPSLPMEADNYPQMSVIGSSQQVEAVASDAAPEHSYLEVKRCNSLEDAIDLLVAAAGSGAACAFVRNSVDEAIAAADAIRARGGRAFLHHARFAMCDRLSNENRVMDLFGKNGRGRNGQIVVGTQVLEQSLDIDFDVMITDLSPIGALIQRAGRLWRHRSLRSSKQRGIDKPTLHVLSPDPSQVMDVTWAQSELGSGYYVYPVSLLWKTAKVLFAEKAIIAPHQNCGENYPPTNIRYMIDSIEGDTVIELPGPILEADVKMQGQVLADSAHAQHNVLEPHTPYMQVESIFKDQSFPTRLGEEQVILRLARWSGHVLKPFADDDDEGRAWAMSEVSISRKRWEKYGDEDYSHPELQRVTDGLQEWQRHVYRICPLAEDGSIANANLVYHPAEGLRSALQERG